MNRRDHSRLWGVVFDTLAALAVALLVTLIMVNINR